MRGFRDLLQSFGTTAVIQAINVATGILAGRLLEPEGRGELAVIMLWNGLLAELGTIGMHDALIYRASTEAAKPRALFAATATLILIVSAVLWVIGVFALPLAMANKDPHLLDLARLFLICYLPTYLAALTLGSLFQGRFDMATWNLLRCLVPVGYLLGILFAWALGAPTVGAFLAANIAGHVLAVGLGLLLARRQDWLAWRPDPAEMRAMLGFGWRVHVGDLLQAVRTRLDQVAIALLLSNAEMGLYAVALTLANAPAIFANTIAYVAFPKVASQAEGEGKREVFGRYLRVSAIVALAILVALALLDDWLIPLLFGRAFTASADLCDVLLLGLVPFTLKLMYMQALKAWNMPLAVSHAELAGLAAAVIALTVLVPRYGAFGAAWSLVIAHLVATSVGALVFHRRTRTSLRTVLTPTRADLQDLLALPRLFRR